MLSELCAGIECAGVNGAGAMKIMIAGVDYTATLDAARELTIERRLNEQTTCALLLSVAQLRGLEIPQRYQPIEITGADGTVYFSGHLMATALPEYAGMAMDGPRYRWHVRAFSDDVLLDQTGTVASSGWQSRTTSSAVAALLTRAGFGKISAAQTELDAPAHNYIQRVGATWSESMATLAAMMRASYRVVSGSVTFGPVPARVHLVSEADGSLQLDGLTLDAQTKRMLANDVTVCGEMEPTAFVQEIFVGDGVTTTFCLSRQPYMHERGTATLIQDLFDQASIGTVWTNTGVAGYLATGEGGLVLNGGKGYDGGTMLSWDTPVEMGGTLLLEMSGVTLAAGSAGVLCAFYGGLDTQMGCAAGFGVSAQQGSGAVVIQPLIAGMASGVPYVLNSADQYVLRMRVYCPEVERAQSIYYSCSDAGAVEAGGTVVAAGGRVQMEVQQCVGGVMAMPVVLFDGQIADLLPTATLVAASSVNLIGCVRSVTLMRLAAGWVTSTPVGGGAYLRRLGSVAESAECALERDGKLVFHTGYVPQVGEVIAVCYRGQGRAVGRVVQAENQQPIAAWQGSVVSPAARSSADCRAAAQALASAAASESALWAGRYATASTQLAADVWPGDALEIDAPSLGVVAQVVVRSVQLRYRASVPEVVRYEIRFANDWAEDLAIRTSITIPEDVRLPAAKSQTVLENLNALTVTQVDGKTITLAAGAEAPAGGGFEVRRRDNAFMAGEDSDLVMRTTVPNMVLARERAEEQFYVRMFDGATPPNYSEFSAAVCVHVPLSA